MIDPLTADTMTMQKKLNFLEYFKSPAKKHKYFNRYFKAIIEDFNVSAFENMYVPLQLKEVYREPGSIVEKERVIDPVTAPGNYPRLVILGAPGAGKTTLLKHLALNCCKENMEKQEHGGVYENVPVPITMREFSGSGKGLRDFIDTVFETYGFQKARKIVEKNLKSGACLLLLDGLDEVVGKESKERIIREVRAFTEKYQHCKIVLTSRIAGYHHEWLSWRQGETAWGFVRLEMMEFDNSRVKQFIDNRFGAANRDKAEAMLRMIMNNKDMETLAKNPLMISTIAARYDEDDDPLPKRADLYKRIIDLMLTEWDAGKAIASQFSPGMKELILGRLAYRNHCRRRRTMTEKDILEEIIGRSPEISLNKEESRVLLEEIWQRSFLLKQLSMDTYDFLHLSVQEYFAALEINRQDDGLAAVTPRISDSWWQEPILLYAGIGKNADPLIEEIQKEMGEDIFYSNLMLSGKCIAEAGFTDPLLKEEIVQDLWHLYNHGEFQLLREKAIAVLARVKPRRIIDLLVNQLTDNDPHIQRAAAETLGLIGSTGALPALVMLLVKEKESKIRSYAAIALGQIGSTEAVLPLINALNVEKDNEVRKSAAEALGLIGSAEAVPALLKVLTTDKNNTVRGSAAEALGKIASAEAAAQLIRALEVEKEKSVRWRIAKSLGKPGDTDARDVLIKILAADNASEVRESAAEALGIIGGSACIDALIRSLIRDKNSDVRGSAAYALGYMRSLEALPVLIRSLITDTNGEVRARAAYALGRLKDIEAIPYLTVVFNSHKESIIRGNATFALGEIGGMEAVPFLMQALIHDKDPYVRYRAAEVLGSTGNDLTIPLLKAALEDEGSYYGWKVKDKAYEALEKIGKRLQVRISRD